MKLSLRLSLIILGTGILFLGSSLVLLFTSASIHQAQAIESEFPQAERAETAFTVDISGSVKKPGVYQVLPHTTWGEVLEKAGGFEVNVDRQFINEKLNLAQVIESGEKLFIPAQGSSSDQLEKPTAQSSLISVNFSSIGALDQLPGVGEKIAQKIIDNRPYGALPELVEKKVLSTSLFEKIKDQLSL